MFDLPQLWSWVLQLSVLSALIYLFLRLARQSRGNRLVRMLVTGALIFVTFLWGLTETLELVELQHILSSVTGFVVVILAIVFQPELRRAIGQLGRSGGGLGASQLDAETLAEVVAAAQSMSRRRRGALLVFERESSLQHWCDRGVALDSRVERLLLESMFETGGALHDGAVLVRGERIVAASCVLPLTEKGDLSQSLGTRHRAGLGITEETDAVALVVSEETGAISIASGGALERAIPPTELEERLRDTLGHSADQTAERSSFDWRNGARRLARHLVGDIYWVVVSAVVAAGLLYVARGQVALEDEVHFELVFASPEVIGDESPTARERRTVQPHRIVVLLEAAGHDFDGSKAPKDVVLEVGGTRSQIERFRREAAGEYRVRDARQPIQLEPALIDWNTDVLGISLGWPGDAAPRIGFVEVAERSLVLDWDELPLDKSKMRQYIAVAHESTTFEPSSVRISGPSTALAALEQDGAEPLFAPIELAPDPSGESSYTLALARTWQNAGVRLLTPVQARLVVARSNESIGSVEVEIMLVCLDPLRVDELESWKLPAASSQARIQVDVIGIVPADADDAWRGRHMPLIDGFVRRNLVAYADLGESTPGQEHLTVPVRFHLRKQLADATTLTELGLQEARLSSWSELRLTLVSDTKIALEVEADQ